MLNLRQTRPADSVGFTLIELMVAVAILMVLAALAMPTFSQWIRNTQIRTAAESVKDGLKAAKAEAINSNTRVVFTLLSPDTTGGTGWNITAIRSGNVVQEKPDREGSATAVLAPTPAGATTVTFSAGLGRRLATNADGTAGLSEINISSVPAGARPLRIVIPAAGDIRMCDPSITTSGDPRAC